MKEREREREREGGRIAQREPMRRWRMAGGGLMREQR